MITSGSSAAASDGSAFSYQITATNSPYSFGASGLPAGLNVSPANGMISGTPTDSGTFNVGLSATNNDGTGTAMLTLTVTGTTPVITSPTSASVTNGSSFSYQITATNSPFSFGASGLPDGLNVSPANGLISGTLTAPGTFSVALSAQNNRGTGNATLTLTVSGGAQASATPSSVSFGSVGVGDTNSQTIALRNAGGATLTFSQISVSGTGFGQTGLSASTTIPAGGSTTFDATFTPSSASSSSGSITLATNGSPSPLVINLSGTGQTVTISLSANPSSLTFGNVDDGQTSFQTVRLTNSGNSNVTISTVNATGAGFSANGVSAGTVLTPQQTATLTVTFSPTTGGTVNGAQVSIASNATGSPTAIPLSGTGMHTVSLSWTASTTSSVTYNVYRGNSAGSESNTPVNSSAITSTTYQDASVTAGQTYYYTVEAVASGGDSKPSNEVSAAVPSP